MAFAAEGGQPQANDPARQKSWQAGQTAFDTGMGALGNQIATAQKTGDVWSGIQKATEAQTAQGMENLKRQAATSLYQSRGSLGGGGGLATIQNANASNAYNLSNFNTQANAQRAQQAQQAQEAQMGAQGQIAQAAGQQYKMLQDQQNRQNRVNSALQMARDVVKRSISGLGLIVTDNERQRAANAIKTEVLANETDPEVINAVNQFVSNLGDYSVPGTIG